VFPGCRQVFRVAHNSLLLPARGPGRCGHCGCCGFGFILHSILGKAQLCQFRSTHTLRENNNKGACSLSHDIDSDTAITQEWDNLEKQMPPAVSGPRVRHCVRLFGTRKPGAVLLASHKPQTTPTSQANQPIPTTPVSLIHAPKTRRGQNGRGRGAETWFQFQASVSSLNREMGFSDHEPSRVGSGPLGPLIAALSLMALKEHPMSLLPQDRPTGRNSPYQKRAWPFSGSVPEMAQTSIDERDSGSPVCGAEERGPGAGMRCSVPQPPPQAVEPDC
jgi:hypothetical protein